MATLTIRTEPTQANGWQGEAGISPEEYEAAGHDELTQAISAALDAECDLAADADAIGLRGYNDDREVLFFAVH